MVITFQLPPESIYSDNGKEFDNSLILNICKKFNVTQRFGFPYHPQTQGAIEAFNKTIHKNLLKKLMASNQDRYSLLEIEALVSKFVSEYNSTIHTTTKFRPQELIHLSPTIESDKKLIEQVAKNIAGRFNKREITDLKEGDYCLMSSVFKKAKTVDILIKKKSRKKGEFQEYRIPVKVISLVGSGNVQVEIFKDEESLNLKKGEN